MQRSKKLEGKSFIKNTPIYILLYLLISTTTYGQLNQSSDFLVLTSRDTLFGAFEHINTEAISPRFYKKIRYTAPDGKRHRIKRKNVMAFRANGEYYERFFLIQSTQFPDKIVLVNPRYDINSVNGTPYFLKLVEKGRLSHYLLEWWDQEDSTPMSMDLLKKEQDSFFIRATQGVFGLKRKVLSEYFATCPELNDLIQQKQLNDVSGIVDFYNRECKN
jgi:hypothetical protein